MSNVVIFEDIFVVENVNPDAKKFDKVSRIEARSQNCDMFMHLDVNTEVYPMIAGEKFTMALTHTVNLDGTPDIGYYTQMIKKKATQVEDGTQGEKKATWPTPLIHIFCDVLIREIENGGLANTHSSPKGWKMVVESFQKESGTDYDYPQLKNKWDQMQKEFSLWRDMIGSDTGLGWDCRKQTVDASVEWWDKKIEDFPNAKKFRTKGIEPKLEDKLRTIFTPIISSGSRAWALLSGARQGEGVNAAEGSGDSQDDDVGLENITVDPVQEKGTQDKRKRPVGTTQLNSKKGKKVGGAIRMAENIERLVSAVESRTPQSTLDRPYSIETCMQLLDEMPDVLLGGEMWCFASRLFINKLKREMFVAIKHELRSIWLKNEHRKEGDI